jgi:hypothetical protein
VYEESEVISVGQEACVARISQMSASLFLGHTRNFWTLDFEHCWKNVSESVKLDSVTWQATNVNSMLQLFNAIT